MIPPPAAGTYRIIYADKLRALAADPNAALELGKAAEHLVCADLILQGYRAYLTDQGLPYDVVVDCAGRLIRIQVKATCRAKNVNSQGRAPREAYCFSARRRGKRGAKNLTDGDCDVVAFCALDIRVVAYLPVKDVAQTVYLMSPGYIFRGRFKRRRHETIDGYPFAEIVRGI